MASLLADAPCPCGSGAAFGQCCQPLLTGHRPATTAEQLMRSRYSAFASGNSDYLLATLHPSQHQTDEREALTASIASCEWLSLRILSTTAGQADDSEGMVEFAARYQQANKHGVLHERSRFIFEDGRWFYIDGEFEPAANMKLGRNDPCWCGSGKKFKKCHG